MLAGGGLTLTAIKSTIRAISDDVAISGAASYGIYVFNKNVALLGSEVQNHTTSRRQALSLSNLETLSSGYSKRTAPGGVENVFGAYHRLRICAANASVRHFASWTQRCPKSPW